MNSIKRFLMGLLKPTRVVLNCGLGAPTYSEDKFREGDRLYMYHHFITDIMNLACIEYRNDAEGEPVLVISGTLKCWVFKFHLARLAALANQDCIAVYYPDSDTGVLAGPHAKEWGPFNKEYFVMPE